MNLFQNRIIYFSYYAIIYKIKVLLAGAKYV